MAGPSREEFETLRDRVEGISRRQHDNWDRLPTIIEGQVETFVRMEVAERLKSINGQYVTWGLLKLIVGALITAGLLEAGILIWVLKVAGVLK